MAFKYKHVFLIADGEKSIADALSRLFGDKGHEIFSSDKGQEALDLLKNNGKVFSLIFSAQQLSDMSGLDFLGKAGNIFPYAMRILLSADSNLEPLVEAVEKGVIDRYFNRLWDDNDLLLHARGILEQYEMIVENRRLEALTKKQNAEIEQLNNRLEHLTEEDPAKEIPESNKGLTRSYEASEKSLYSSIKNFLALIEKYDSAVAEHGRRVSILARDLAEMMELPAEEILKIEVGGLLHDIGKAGFPAHLLEYDLANWTPQDKKNYYHHPSEGEKSIRQLGQLEDVGLMIRMHHEQFDGKGFPDQLKEAEIPLGARIIAVANAFDNVFNQRIHSHMAMADLIEQSKAGQPHIETDDIIKKVALVHLKKEGFRRYDPAIVDRFIQLMAVKGKNYGKAIF